MTGTNLLTMRLQKNIEKKKADIQRQKEEQKVIEEQNEVERLHRLVATFKDSSDTKKIREIYNKILSIRPDDHRALWGICVCDRKEEKDQAKLYLQLQSVDEFVKKADDIGFIKDRLDEIETEYKEEIRKQNDHMTSRNRELDASRKELESLNAGFKSLKAPEKAKRIVAMVSFAVLAIVLTIARFSLKLEDTIDNTVFFSLIVMVCWMGAFLLPFLFFYHGSHKIDREREDYQKNIDDMENVVDASEDKVKMIEDQITSYDQRMEMIRGLYDARLEKGAKA